MSHVSFGIYRKMKFTLPNGLTLELHPEIEITIYNTFEYHTIKFLDSTPLLLEHYCPILKPLDKVLINLGYGDLITFIDDATFRVTDEGYFRLTKFVLSVPASENAVERYYARKEAQHYS